MASYIIYYTVITILDKFGYARISTPKQSLDYQLHLLKEHGCEKIFSDIISGYDSKKTEFEKMMDQIRSNDTITVTGIDRLGRSTKDLSIFLDEIHQRGIDLIILGYDIDTRTSHGRMIFNLMALIAENERMRNIERIQQGISSARKRGKKIGRPIKFTQYQINRIISFYKSNSLSVNDICVAFKISKTTLYKYINSNNIKLKKIK